MLRSLRFVSFFLALLLLPTGAYAQTNDSLESDEDIPLNPDVRTGTLDNGLRYFILPNSEPQNRMALRLAVNAGSILEEPDQRGLAHLTEHMLFNGTRHFEKHEIVDFMESIGMQFGADLNAHTSFSETVYKLQVPTDSAYYVQTAFDILRDWAAYATLSTEQIKKERGVVYEEYRSAYETARGRMQEEILPVVLHDSRFAKRRPIGQPEIIKNADPEAVRRFYQDWYRPGLMAVVAVGDFEPARIEKLIKENFSKLENSDDPRERPSYEVPDHDETLYVVASDPEFPRTSVQVLVKREHEETDTVADLRERLTAQLYRQMLGDRLDQVARRKDASFLSAGIGHGSIVRPIEAVSLFVRTQEGNVLKGLESALTEIHRVREHGFTRAELKRAKEVVLTQLKSAYKERENTPSSHYASQLVGHFLEGSPAASIEYRYEKAQQLLPAISLSDVNALAGRLFQQENRVVIVQMPEKDGLEEPTKQQMAAVLNSVPKENVEPWQGETVDQPLISDVPEPATVTDRSGITELGVTTFTLGNGVRVVMKPTDFKKDQVLLTAFSPGGSSLVSDEDYFEAAHIGSIMAESGLASFTPPQLEKRLAGKQVSVSPYISGVEEGFSGNAAPEDLETLFKLVHLYVSAPRADSTGLRLFRRQMEARLKNRSRQPIFALLKAYTNVIGQGNPRVGFPTMEEVRNLNLQRGAEIYRMRFADMGDFTFVFVGNLEPERVERLARTYLGTLPSTEREESWRDVMPAFPEGISKEAVYKGQGERSFTILAFGGSFEYTRQNRHRLQSMVEILNIRLRETLREEMSGVYSVRANGSTSSRPDDEYSVTIIFSSGPDSVERLVDATFSVIDSLQAAPATEQEMTKVTQQQLRSRETALEENSFWLSRLAYYYSHEGEPTAIRIYPGLVKSLTAKEVQQAAQRYLSEDRFVKVVLYPEGYGNKASAGKAQEKSKR